MMYKYVLFDLDGTLTDPGVGITNSVAYALERYGIEVSDRSELYRFIGPPLVDSFVRYYGFAEKDAKEAVTVYREYFTERGMFENEVYPGIPEMLASLRGAGIKPVVATSKPWPFAEKILEHFGLREYFDFVAGAELDETRTSKSDVIAYALETCGINPDEAVMVGDREHDILGAKANGMKSVGVLFGYGSRDELENAGADEIAADVSELGKILMK